MVGGSSQGPVTPVIEDAAFAKAALAALPVKASPMQGTWKVWTEAVKAGDGGEGQGAVHAAEDGR
jgi:glutamyl-tRNA synthetase